MADKKTTMYS